MKFKQGLFLLVIGLIMTGTTPLQAQQDRSAAQQTAFDLYHAIRQQDQPESLAVWMHRAITIFRYDCERLREYQIYRKSPNIIHMKVKCVGLPIYGLTVASNGYLSVYGGNGMVSGLEAADERIYSFLPDGTLEPYKAPELKQYVDENIASDEDIFYMILSIGFVVLVIIGFALLWLRIWNRVGRNSRQFIEIESELKTDMIHDSDEVSEGVYRHPIGLYIAVGPRGKRRVFPSKFTAWIYNHMGFKFRELTSSAALNRFVEEGESQE